MLSPKGQRIVLLLFVVALSLHASIYLTHAWATFIFPYQLDFGEGAVLCLAETLHRHEPIYRTLDQPPFLAGLYVPIFPWLASFFLGAIPSFAGGRMLAELSTILFVATLGMWLGRNRGRTAAVMAMALYLANPVVLGWNCLERIDSLGLLFSLWGVLLVSHHSKQIPGGAATRLGLRDGLAVICFTLAFFDKQTLVAGPVSAFLALLITDRRLAWRFALLQAACIGVGLFALYYTTEGQFFTLLFRYNAMPFSFEQLFRYLEHYAIFLVPLAILSFRAREAPLVCRLYALLSLWVVFGSGRFAADYNYFLEIHGALALLAGWGLASPRTGLLEFALALVQVLGIGIFMRLGPTFYSPKDYLLAEALPLWSGGEPRYMTLGKEAGGRLEEVIAQHPGPMISENMGNALLAGRVPWMCDPATFMGLINRNLWDQELVLKPLRENEVKVVTLQQLDHNLRFSDLFLQTVKEHYVYVGKFGVDHLFVAPQGR